MFFIKTENKRT